MRGLQDPSEDGNGCLPAVDKKIAAVTRALRRAGGRRMGAPRRWVTPEQSRPRPGVREAGQLGGGRLAALALKNSDALTAEPSDAMMHT
jgi:hypothetical protein